MTAHDTNTWSCLRCGGPAARSTGFGRLLNGNHPVCATCGWVWTRTELATGRVQSTPTSTSGLRYPVRAMLILHAVVTGAAASFVLVWWFFVELGLSFGTDPALAEQDLREIRWMIRGLIIVGIGGMFAIAAWAHLTRPQRLRWLAVIEVFLIVVGGLVIHSLM